jgi:hypothetical protein
MVQRWSDNRPGMARWWFRDGLVVVRRLLGSGMAMVWGWLDSGLGWLGSCQAVAQCWLGGGPGGRLTV